MSTTTDEIIEPEVAQEPRNINVLLSLDTYQGMSDEEIESVLNYRVDRAVSSRETLARIAAITAREEQVIADNAASAAAARSVIESMVRREFPEIRIEEPQRFVPRGLEL